MKLSFRRFYVPLAAAGLLILAGCGDKHEPTKPTVDAAVAAAARTLLPT